MPKKNESGHVSFDLTADQLQTGRHVRYQGENIKSGAVAVPAGIVLKPPQLATAVSFCSRTLFVRRLLRVSIINTGNELLPAGEAVLPWQIRDSNGPMLQAMIERHPTFQVLNRIAVEDEPHLLRAAMDASLQTSDVVLLTGGVSAGNYDYVPQTLQSLGTECIFHRLPMKPGKPIYVGIGPQQQLVCGLPGNPISVAVTARRIAIPLMHFAAGQNSTCLAADPILIDAPADTKPLPLVKFQLVNRTEGGEMQWDLNRGSGDVASLGNSAGFIEYNPFIKYSTSKRLFYAW